MERLPDPERSRAVLIGMSTYADRDLSPLLAVRANLEDLREVLTAPWGTGLPEAHCEPLLDPPDTGPVMTVLDKAAAEAEDMLLVYYAGHGLTWLDRPELYLALGNTQARNAGPTALRCADLRDVLTDTRATTRVLIVDCCFSGRAFGPMSASADVLLNQVTADVEGSFILAATQENELALAPPGARNTLFTGELLRLLRDGVRHEPQRDLITLDILCRHLRATMKVLSKPLPTCNGTNGAGHLALIPNAAVPRHRARLETLRATVDDLTAAEAETQQECEKAMGKIADPGLPPWAPRAAAFHARLNGLIHLAKTGGWQPAADERLATLERNCAEFLDETHKAGKAARSLLDRRKELRELWQACVAAAVERNVAEDAAIAGHRDRARNLLWTAPCDLRAAEDAVRTFCRSVNTRQEPA